MAPTVQLTCRHTSHHSTAQYLVASPQWGLFRIYCPSNNCGDSNRNPVACTPQAESEHHSQGRMQQVTHSVAAVVVDAFFTNQASGSVLEPAYTQYMQSLGHHVRGRTAAGCVAASTPRNLRVRVGVGIHRAVASQRRTERQVQVFE